MASDQPWLLYGANGYTGELIAREAVSRGMRPVLAGRKREAVEKLAQEIGCEPRVFALDDPAQIADNLRGIRAVLNCAGPFSQTAAPMMDACLQAPVHYLDITGEIDVIESAAARDSQAKAAGVSIIPSVGFDVVPSDCLAAMLAAVLPDATHLQLAFGGLAKVSPGTLKTMIENLPRGGRARIDGKIQRVPIAWKTMEIPFADKPRLAVTIPWGDVASAYYSTGIQNIEVYAATPARQIRLLRWMRPATAALRLKPVRSLVFRWVTGSVHGPSAEERATARAQLWGRVTNGGGQSVTGALTTPEGYHLTKLTALACLENLLAGSVPPGFRTPSQAFGRDFVLEIPGVAAKI